MYRKKDNQQTIDDFILPFNGALAADNRWVIKAQMIPWDDIEGDYADLFPSNTGNMAKPVRLAFGALVIKETLGLTDEETVEQIRKNPYLQYFFGFKKFSCEKPFNPLLMVRFRQRFSIEKINAINETICKQGKKDDDEQPATGGNAGWESSGETLENKGKLIMDATCVSADTRCPTDLSLLNEEREKTESFIDIFYEPLKGKINKPRTYHKVARADYLATAKMRKPRKKQLCKELRKQFGYLRRNLKSIERLEEYHHENPLTISQSLTLKVENHIVNISQPHVQPIVRGRARASVEFGAKLASSVVDGFAYMEKLSWDKFGEGKRRYGLNLIKAKLQETSETVIIINPIVMNLAHLHRGLVVLFSKSIFRVFRAKILLQASRFLPTAA